jgi:REP element-mobilizing transposase RayT
MRRARFLSPWKDSHEKPVVYHVVSRIVERRFALGIEEKERFRTLMRMMEKFTGCRVLSYCLMCNHIHILLEVPPVAESGISDGDFLARLSVLYGEAFVADVAGQLESARTEGGLVGGNPARVAEIKERFTYRMHDLGQFMKGLLQRFSQWFNTRHKRTGTLWEQRFKSVIVEGGIAARTMAAYIDLNPVRAGMVEDPADYRWSSYGEAMGGGKKGNGKKAREGLVRAVMSDTDVGFDAEHWKEASRRYRRLMGLALERKTLNAKVVVSGKMRITKNDAEALESGDNQTVLPELNMAKMLRCRVRYFTEGAVIGGKGFVNEVFAASRERFSEKRKDGARRMRGNAKAAGDTLWSVRDLRVG